MTLAIYLFIFEKQYISDRFGNDQVMGRLLKLSVTEVLRFKEGCTIILLTWSNLGSVNICILKQNTENTMSVNSLLQSNGKEDQMGIRILCELVFRIRNICDAFYFYFTGFKIYRFTNI